MSDQVGFGAATSAAHVAATVNNRDAQQAPQGQQTADLAKAESTPAWRDSAVVQGNAESARQESRRGRDPGQQPSERERNPRQDAPTDSLRSAEQTRRQNKPAAVSNKGPAATQDSLQRDAGERQKEVRRQEARDRVVLTPTAAELVGTPDIKARFDMNTDGRVDQVELQHAIRARDNSNSYGGLAYHRRGTTEVDPATGEVVIAKESAYPLPGEQQADEQGSPGQEPAFPLPGEGNTEDRGRAYEELLGERGTYEELVAAGVIREPADAAQQEPPPPPPETTPPPAEDDGPSAYEELVESRQQEAAPLVTDEPEPYLPGPTPADGQEDDEQSPPPTGGVSILA